MIALSTRRFEANRFDFAFQTSSGDKISLSMYDRKNLSFDASRDGKGSVLSMSLRHEYGYRFHYEGNGIDAQDRKEIEAAMKKIEPLFEKFLEKVKESDEIRGYRELNTLAQRMRDMLPKPETVDAENLMKEKTVDTMDAVLALFQRNDKLLEGAKRLFDKLFDQMHRFDIYA